MEKVDKNVFDILYILSVGHGSPGGNTLQGTNYSANCHPLRKLYKLDEPDTLDTAGEARTNILSDVLLWTPAYGQAKAGRPARTYIQQLCQDTGCNPEDLPETMNDREKWRERDIRASGTTWWWWYILTKISFILRTSWWIYAIYA